MRVSRSDQGSAAGQRLGQLLTSGGRIAEARSPRPTPPVPTHSVSEVGCPLVGLGRKLFEAEAGFAFQAPRQLTAVQSSEAGLQPDERMLDLRFRFLDRNAFSPAVSPNRSKHGCQMQRL
jgi:hypothetical protein